MASKLIKFWLFWVSEMFNDVNACQFKEIYIIGFSKKGDFGVLKINF